MGKLQDLQASQEASLKKADADRRAYAAARAAVYLAPNGKYPVSHKGEVVGECVITNGEPEFKFNADQTALVADLAKTDKIIAFGGVGKIVSGELQYTKGTIYIS